MSRPRDSQKSKFYLWKDGELRTLEPPKITLINSSNAEDCINGFVKSYGFKEPSYQWRKSVSPVGFNGGTITLDSRWVQIHPSKIALVVAWTVYWRKYMSTSLNESWHGPTFCRVFAETYSSLTGVPVQDVIKSMKAAKLRVAGASGGAPAGPRVVKQYEKARDEYETLERSVRNARKDFEEFLKPVLAKLEAAKKKKAELELKIRG
jgi:hypothetical protein